MTTHLTARAPRGATADRCATPTLPVHDRALIETVVDRLERLSTRGDEASFLLAVSQVTETADQLLRLGTARRPSAPGDA